MADEDYQAQLGARLRAVRTQQGLTLADVETRSDGRWKAVVVGSYERGDRAVSVARLSELAEFYDVPVGHLLPDGEEAAGDRITLDLTGLDDLDEEHGTLVRFVRRIQQERGDYNGRVLTVRASDVRAMAVVLDTDEDALRRDLVGAGVAQVR